VAAGGDATEYIGVVCEGLLVADGGELYPVLTVLGSLDTCSRLCPQHPIVKSSLRVLWQAFDHYRLRSQALEQTRAARRCQPRYEPLDRPVAHEQRERCCHPKARALEAVHGAANYAATETASDAHDDVSWTVLA
jgi:hypothetical protein